MGPLSLALRGGAAGRMGFQSPMRKLPITFVKNKLLRLMSENQPRGFKVDYLDHFVITVNDINRTVAFYTKVLGMEAVTFKGGTRTALCFGKQKINVHEQGKEFEPKASQPVPGSADVCFITSTHLRIVMEHFKTCGVPIMEGPVTRTGAMGSIRSVYVRDPDDNLIEVANYENEWQ